MLVADIVKLLGRTLGGSVRLATNTSADAGVALADPSALEAAVLNIALNARDAMPDGGTLTIRTSRADVSKAPATDDDLTPGSYAVLALQDTGTGMPPDVAAKVFDHFRRRAARHGPRSRDGLRVREASGGTVTIDRHRQETTVSIFLPLSDAHVEALGSRLAGAGRGWVLLVEDETKCATSSAGSWSRSAIACWWRRPRPKRCCS